MEGRSGLVASTLGSRLYICAGQDGATPLKSMECLTSSEDFYSWEAAEPLLERRQSPSAAALESHIYVCGGRGESGGFLSSVESFSAESGLWQPLRSFHVARMGAAATVLGGKLY